MQSSPISGPLNDPIEALETIVAPPSSRLLGRGRLALVGRRAPITPEDVRAILVTPDPVQRNLRITLGYHDITLAMAELLGHDSVVWTGFATWASRVAGRFVRGDYLPEMAQSAVHRLTRVRRRLEVLGWARPDAPVLTASVEEAVARVSRTISESAMEGNLSVFADVAPLFARMIAELRPGRRDDAAIERIVADLRPGPTENGGQDLLIGAARNYYAAMLAASDKARAELILLANNQVGFHEQLRLQPFIHRCLNAPVSSLVGEPARAEARSFFHGLIDRALDAPRLEREWAAVATRFLMRMDLPQVTLRLGHDLPPFAAASMFPEHLRVIENDELCALLYRVDRTPNTTAGSGARDWGDIGERMNFIVDLFRTRQQDPTLFLPPFSPSQIEVIRRGGIPGGAL